MEGDERVKVGVGGKLLVGRLCGGPSLAGMGGGREGGGLEVGGVVSRTFLAA